jgi:hypothetical protein
MAIKAFAAVALTGGTAGALDDIIHTNVSDGDMAFVNVKTGRTPYVFVYDSSSSASEEVATRPYVVKPDSNGGNGRWLEQLNEFVFTNGNNVAVLEGTDTGITVGNGTDTAKISLVGAGGDLYIDNQKDSGLVYIRGYDSGSAVTSLITGDPDGVVDLYYDGVKALGTDATGAIIYDTSGSIPTLTFKDDGGVEKGQILAGATTIQIESNGEICLVGTKDGSTDLYYDNTKKFETTAAGVSIGDGTATGITLGYTADDAYLVNTDPDGVFYIQSRNAADAATNTLFKGDPDDAVELYHAGNKAVATSSLGLYFYNSSAEAGSMTMWSGDLYLDCQEDSGQIIIRSKNSASAVKSLFVGNPDGAAELYHTGTKRISTKSDGATVVGNQIEYGPTTGSEGYMYHSGTNMSLNNSVNSGSVFIYGDDAADAQKTLFDGDPDGSTQLFYNGVRRIETDAYGLSIYRDATYPCKVFGDGNAWYLIHYEHGLPWVIKAENASGTAKDLFKADPDGAAEIYDAGLKVFSTRSSGINIFNSSNQMYIAESGSAWNVVSLTHGYPIVLSGENASGVSKDLVKADPDGGAELYYAGTKHFATVTNGVGIYDGGALNFEMVDDGSSGGLKMINYVDDQYILLRGYTGAASKNMIVAYPQSYVELLYAGTSCFKTDLQNGKYGAVLPSTGVKILTGTGTPESAVTAGIGSIYLRSDGGAGTSFYVKESGAGNTGWVGK